MIAVGWVIVIGLVCVFIGMWGAAMCAASGQAERCAKCELKQWLEDNREQ